MDQIGLIILAAGSSSRMGSPKQLLLYNGRTLLRHAAETALASICEPVLVVLGAAGDLLEPQLAGLPVMLSHNPDWSLGMGSSIRHGLQQLVARFSGSIRAVVIMVCDQPLVRPTDLNELCAVHDTSGYGVVSSRYGGNVGVPVLFSSRYFRDLGMLDPSAGAKKLIIQHADDHHSVGLSAGAFDIDTPEDYSRMMGQNAAVQD
jgi:molybdenum cofactor cytidylyltransferase